MPTNRVNLKRPRFKNVRVVPVEPKVKSEKTCELFLRSVSARAQTVKSADPSCYDTPSTTEIVMDYASHIARICKIEDIAVESHSSGGRAYRKRRLIKVRPVKTAITYAIALHEIGHILGPRQTGKNTRLDKEVGAWEWAEQHAIEWTDAMSAVRARCLKSYLAKAERSPHMRQAGANHPIHAML